MNSQEGPVGQVRGITKQPFVDARSKRAETVGSASGSTTPYEQTELQTMLIKEHPR
jgi:hypothetical protein